MSQHVSVNSPSSERGEGGGGDGFFITLLRARGCHLAENSESFTRGGEGVRFMVAVKRVRGDGEKSCHRKSTKECCYCRTMRRRGDGETVEEFEVSPSARGGGGTTAFKARKASPRGLTLMIIITAS
jgi:hypothetical protein